MRGTQTIVMNGKVYDVATGLPVAAPPTHKPTKPASTDALISDFGPVPQSRNKRPVGNPSNSHHTVTKRSTTLRRDILSKPASKAHHVSNRPSRQAGHVARSPQISRFAPRPQPIAQESIRSITPVEKVTAPAQSHPVVAKAIAKQSPAAVATKPVVSAREHKQSLIEKHLDQAPTAHKAEHKQPRKSIFTRVPSVIAACFAVVVLGGYLTYLNMPSLSVRVAASQAGINASLPGYQPDGYRFSGPVAFSPGQVTVTYRANGGSQWFNINQQTSSWDSQAVLDNLVSKKSDSYLTYSEQGVTIYTFDNQAAWVNGGVLYTIDGQAPLSNDQVLKIASSM